jgi:hypothetical protein
MGRRLTVTFPLSEVEKEMNKEQEFNPQRNEKDAEKKLTRRLFSFIEQSSKPMKVKFGKIAGVRIPKLLFKYDEDNLLGRESS